MEILIGCFGNVVGAFACMVFLAPFFLGFIVLSFIFVLIVKAVKGRDN
jgi:hypothetical protein